MSKTPEVVTVSPTVAANTITINIATPEHTVHLLHYIRNRFIGHR